MEHIEPEETRNHRGGPSNPFARYQLAKIILADPAAEQERFRTALEWLTEAAEAGLVPAQYKLGKIYRDGRGVEKDALLAAAWLTRAVEQGSDAASYALGALLLTGGEGLAKDILSALNWLRRSAEDGNWKPSADTPNVFCRRRGSRLKSRTAKIGLRCSRRRSAKARCTLAIGR